MVSFCARTTEYAKLLRRVTWPSTVSIGLLVSAEMIDGGSAQRMVPAALGQALAAYLDGRLGEEWVSRDHLPLSIERLK